MSEVKKDTVNSVEIKKSEASAQVDIGTKPAELINNTKEEPKDNNEIKKEQKKEDNKEKTNKVIVSYIGSGIWKDSHGELWAISDRASSIKSERQYTADEYEKRDDIKFMIQYGSMKITYVK